MIGGLPQPWLHEHVLSMGFTPDAIARRNALTDELPSDLNPLIDQGVRWVVAGVVMIPGLVRTALRSAFALGPCASQKWFADRCEGQVPVVVSV